jgi:hypothetical protein
VQEQEIEDVKERGCDEKVRDEGMGKEGVDRRDRQMETNEGGD